MTDDRKIHLMHRALDEELTPEAERELSIILDEDSDNAAQFNRLRHVESLLRAAPHERAPERLALTIMARLAETVQEQQFKGKLNAQEVEINEAMMNVAISMVAVATMPLLMGASWMLLNAKSNPKTLDSVLQQVAALLILTLDVMQILLEEAEAAFHENPQAAMALLALIPPTLLTLVRYMLDDGDDLD